MKETLANSLLLSGFTHLVTLSLHQTHKPKTSANSPSPFQLQGFSHPTYTLNTFRENTSANPPSLSSFKDLVTSTHPKQTSKKPQPIPTTLRLQRFGHPLHQSPTRSACEAHNVPKKYAHSAREAPLVGNHDPQGAQAGM